MAFQPVGTLSNRTFVGLIVAQFLAGFNDQAIHAAAMFYAIRQEVLTEAQAITLMPILFYAPWAIFCTLAGYMADRHSKTFSLITWKVSEIIISLVLMLGLYFGTNLGQKTEGVALVMSCVFLMGTHAAFFAPAKYGAMPEVLQPHMLSKGNGILESTTFLASILGTVSGGVLSDVFHGREVWIGVVLLVLSLIGAGASLMIAWLPPANPARPFPVNLLAPLIANLKTLLRARPLALSVLGIAFFIFMVSYMRAAVYMHGETRNPRWPESYTSLIVATVALGVGLGSPLAGYLSGGKIELGMVPLACVGMMVALGSAAAAIEHDAALIVALIVIGFFSGFYMVPLYTLLQHRAPKQSKGDLIATSNFINVTGAISASLLFGLLVFLSRQTGIAPQVPVQDRVVVGELLEDPRKEPRHGHIQELRIQNDDGGITVLRAKRAAKEAGPAPEFPEHLLDDLSQLIEQVAAEEQVIDFDDNLLETLGKLPQKGDRIIVSRYEQRGVVHFLVRGEDQPLKDVFDNEALPRYLFLGAALMNLGILLLLLQKLPDFFVRMLFWLRSLGKFQLRAVGTHHLPTHGPVVLATNTGTITGSLQLVSATDRYTLMVLVEEGEPADHGLVRSMAGRVSLVELREGQIDAAAWAKARDRALQALADGHLLAVSVASTHHDAEIEQFLRDLRVASGAPIVPVYCGPRDPGLPQRPPQMRVVFGKAVADEPVRVSNVRSAIDKLGEWVRLHDDEAALAAH